MKSDNWFGRIGRIISPLFLYMVLGFVVEFIAVMMGTVQVQSEHGASIVQDYDKFYEYLIEWLNEWTLVITAAIAIACIPFLIAMYVKDGKKIKMKQADVSMAAYAALPILGVSACFLLNGLLSVSGLSELLSEGYEETSEAIYGSDIVVQYVSAAVLVPIMEELIFRGLIFRRMRTYSIFSLAALVSAAIFGLYHMNLLQFIYATCLGLILAYAYEKFKSISAPILVHAFANAFSIYLTADDSVTIFLAGSETRMIVSLTVSLVLTAVSIALIGHKTVKKQ